MIKKSHKFSLKQKDFVSGKMVSPPRDEWKHCDCCNKLIVQGVVMSNGDHIGNDCYEVVMRVPGELQYKGTAEGLFKMFGTMPKVQAYALNAAK
jgi:hypothetical protein